MTLTNLQVKKAQVEVLEKLVNTLEEIKKDTIYDYRVVGKKDTQAKNWKTGELVWEDEEHTIPKYDDKYDYVKIPDDERTPEQSATLQAIETIEIALDKLI